MPKISILNIIVTSFIASLIYFLYILNSGGSCQSSIAEGEVRVAKIPEASKFGFTTVDDKYDSDNAQHLMWLFEFDVRGTVFENTNQVGMLDVAKTGVIEYGLYTGGSIYTDLQLKTPRYASLDAAITEVTIANNGKVPTVLSYAFGKTGYARLMYSRFLGGRNSEHANDGGSTVITKPYKYNGLSAYSLINRASTNRWVYYGEMDSGPKINWLNGTQTEGESDYERKLLETDEVCGFYTSFGHWHWAKEDYFKRYLTKIKEVIGSKDCFFGTYSEFVEYYYVRESVVSVQRNDLSIVVNYKALKSRPFDLITTPLWLEINTKGTSLEGLPIQCGGAVQIVKKGEDHYALGFVLDYDLTTITVNLSQADSEKSYNNQTTPVVSVNNSTGTVTSDQPITYVLFSKLKTEDEWEVKDVEYQHSSKTVHTLNTILDTVNNDYYLGFSNASRKSGLISFYICGIY